MKFFQKSLLSICAAAISVGSLNSCSSDSGDENAFTGTGVSLDEFVSGSITIQINALATILVIPQRTGTVYYSPDGTSATIPGLFGGENDLLSAYFTYEATGDNPSLATITIAMSNTSDLTDSALLDVLGLPSGVTFQTATIELNFFNETASIKIKAAYPETNLNPPNNNIVAPAIVEQEYTNQRMNVIR